jgi:hypothetical protein
MNRRYLITAFCCALATTSTARAETPVGDTFTKATTAGGSYISWREHIIDDPTIAGFALSGSDGLVMGDIDQDGFEDIVSVHESDTNYDSASHDPNFIPPPEGHVRIAFGSADPDRWTNITIAEGTDAPAPEDAAIADVNGDGFPDVMVAAELSHLIYLQNPGKQARTTEWPRLILPMTKDKGSYIRVFFADLDSDGTPEAIAANKGAQRPGPEDYAISTPVSIYRVNGDPLSGDSWQETDIGYYSVPQNSEPIDIDSDGDLDIIIGSRGEQRIAYFENIGGDKIHLQEHAIGIVGALGAGFNMVYGDINGDNLLDIIGPTSKGLGWIAQPQRQGDAWNFHLIGTISPDQPVGLEIADINSDGYSDILVGSYSHGKRDSDSNINKYGALGRIAWFENPNDITSPWTRHDISRRKRGMYDKFIARDLDQDGDIDFLGTRGNSAPYDGVIWLEQIRSEKPRAAFERARPLDSPEMPLADD